MDPDDVPTSVDVHDRDHYFEEGKKPALLLDRGERPQVLRAAGYSCVELLRDEGGMALYSAH